MAYRTLELDREGAVARLTLNRPDKLNAVSTELIRELSAVVAELNEDFETKVVIVTGAGRAFCVGADVGEMPGDDVEAQITHVRRRSRLGLRAVRGFAELEQITIAAINGWAIGGGLSIAMACDIRLAAEGTRFFIPEVDYGLPYIWSSTAMLARLIGPARAKELVLTCDRFTAEQAREWGLVSSILPAEKLIGEAEALAQKIAAKPALALRATKAVANAISAPFGDVGLFDHDLAVAARALGETGTARDAFLGRK